MVKKGAIIKGITVSLLVFFMFSLVGVAFAKNCCNPETSTDLNASKVSDIEDSFGRTGRTVDGVTYKLESNYLTLFWGEKPTGGYVISIEKVKLQEACLYVYYSLEYSDDEGPVITASTYPKDSKGVQHSKEDIDRVVLKEVNEKVEEKKESLHVYVDGTKVGFPDQKPFTSKDNRVLAPVRFVMEELGAEVNWSAENQTVNIRKGGNKLTLTIGEAGFIKNGEAYTTESYPMVFNGRTMVPLRFVGDVLGLHISCESTKERRIIRLSSE